MRRIESPFAPEAQRSANTLLGLIISDYVAYYGPTTRMRQRWGVAGSWNEDSPRRLALLFLPRMLNNPCMLP